MMGTTVRGVLMQMNEEEDIFGDYPRPRKTS